MTKNQAFFSFLSTSAHLLCQTHIQQKNKAAIDYLTFTTQAHTQKPTISFFIKTTEIELLNLS